MTHVLENLVEQTSTSTGAETLVLSGTVYAPLRSFATVMADGDTTEAMVVNRNAPTERQAAIYRYADGSLTFVRRIDEPGADPVSFGVGLKTVTMAPLAQRGEWVRRSGSFDLIPGDNSDVDTSDAPATATLPASLAEGERFGFNDFAGSWGTNPLTIDPNGHLFQDAEDGSDPSQPMTCRTSARFELIYAAGKLRPRA